MNNIKESTSVTDNCFNAPITKKGPICKILSYNNAKLITNLVVKKFNKYFINFKYYKNYTHSYYTYACLLKKNINFSRKDICVFLEKNGIETRPLFAGCLPDQPAFVNKKIK